MIRLYASPVCRSDGELLVTLISKHLVRLLKTAPSLQVLDAATLAIQELLRHYSQAEGLPPPQEAAGQGLGAGAGEAPKGWPAGVPGQRFRETTPAVVESNSLFSALAAEVQVRFAVPVSSFGLVLDRPALPAAGSRSSATHSTGKLPPFAGLC